MKPKPVNDPQLAGKNHPAFDPRGRPPSPEPIARDITRDLETIETPDHKRPPPGL
jgi:hypothetical protein